MTTVTIKSDMNPIQVTQAIANAVDAMSDDENQLKIIHQTTKEEMERVMALQFKMLFNGEIGVKVETMKVENGELILETILELHEE